MADRFVIEGIRPYDGEYPLEGDEFTTREWSWIKKHSGYLPMTVEEGFRGGDPELFSVLAVIAMVRAGRIQNHDVPGVVDRMADSPFGSSIKFVSDDEEGEEEDPPDAPSVTA